MTAIKIICNSDRHPRKVAKIETFGRVSDGTWSWRYATSVYAEDEKGRSALGPHPAGTAGLTQQGGVRLRLRLECKLCGPASSVIFRGDRIGAVLDDIAEKWPRGEPFPLSLLGRLVSRQG